MRNEAKLIEVPDAAHPITIDADTARVVVRGGDAVIAETRDALTLREHGYAPVYYIPLTDVVPARLRPSSNESYCPYKGDASYYDIVLPDGDVLTDAVWTYRNPYPAVATIAGRVAFYTDRVQIEADLGHRATERANELGQRAVAVNSILPTTIDGAGVFTQDTSEQRSRRR